MRKLAIGLGILMMLAASGAEAFEGWGPRAGFRFGGPDQIVAGAHMDWGAWENGFRLRPMADVGFGDHITLLTVNGDALYDFRDIAIGSDAWFYGGVGIAIVTGWLDCKNCPSDTRTEAGINFILGVNRELTGGNQMFGEWRATIEEDTFLQATIGYTFGN